MEPRHKHGRMSRPSSGSGPSRQILHCLSSCSALLIVSGSTDDRRESCDVKYVHLETPPRLQLPSLVVWRSTRDLSCERGSGSGCCSTGGDVASATIIATVGRA